MLEVLPHERWSELEGIFRKEFDSYLPDPTSIILADIEDGEIKGFLVVEFLHRIGLVYQPGSKSRAMFDYFDKQIKPGSSVIAIASDTRFESLCEKYGMYPVEGKVFRKDF